MDSLRLIMLFSFSYILLQVASVIVAQPDFKHQDCRNDVGYYTANSTFGRNLNSLFSSLDSNTQVDYGFYNLSVGQTGPDQANAMALCRGDIRVDDCRSCIRNSTHKILQVCPNQKEAIGVYDICMLRYSNKSISGVVEGSPIFCFSNVQNATDVNKFNEALQALMSRLRSKAASGDSLRKFATGNETAGSDTIFGLVQCTPDLSEEQCDDCLSGAIDDIATGCDGKNVGKQGGRITRPSCYILYELFPFFGDIPGIPQLPTPPSPQAHPVPPPPPAEGKKSSKARAIIIIVVPTVSVVILIICLCIFLTIWKPKEKVKMEEIESAESLQFAFSTIRVATEDFSEQNKLGQGGFGPVYKGTLPSGQEIAVKRLSQNSGQGDLEFKNEVLLVAKLQHRSLVRLLGFCLQGTERLLIYEFVPNSSLDHFIFDPTKRVHLNWEMRYKIIGGIARGLLYLHEDSRLRIIHRDLKASNILLDEEMNPKISDFGMARLFVVDQTHGSTRRIVGTYGYMAPEYAIQGQFSAKSDVFSFGVLVLEIMSGQKNSFCNGDNIEHLMSHAWKHLREGTVLELIDPILRGGPTTEMIRCIHIGLLCVQENVADRPTMASVVLMLSSSSLTLQIPSKPAFFMGSSTYQSNMSSSRVTESLQSEIEAIPLSRNEASITELNPR